MLEDSSTKQAARSGHREQSETSELLKSGTSASAVHWHNVLNSGLSVGSTVHCVHFVFSA